MEAQLLGRKDDWLNKNPTFLDEFEKEIEVLTGSFKRWRNAQLESAKQDHLAALENATMALDNLLRRS
jgi:hypothetical protein